MLRAAALLFLLACASCMEMRETVERMVMVRTTGSDLQPAATGYIYKKKSDGPVSVVEMGETEVMEHLSKLYEQPKAFAAPIPIAAGPFYANEDEDKVVSSSSESKVIPVVEKQEEKDDHVDGLANDEYGNIFGEYASDFGNYKSDFEDYLKSLGHFEDGVYHDHEGGKAYGSKAYHDHGDSDEKGFGNKQHYEKGGAGNYHTKEYKSYKISGEGSHKKHYGDADAFGKHYAQEHGYKGGNHGFKAGQSKGEAGDGFHKLFDKNEYKKDDDFYDTDAVKGGFHKYAGGHANHESAAGGFGKGSSLDSGHHGADFKKGIFHDKESGDEQGEAHSAEEDTGSFQQHHGGFGAKGGKYNGKSYGYEIKH